MNVRSSLGFIVALVNLYPLVSCMPNTKLSASCPAGWILHRQSCYFFGKQPLNWFNAAQRCRDLGGYLVTVNDAAENAFLVNYMRNGPLSRYFTIAVGRINPTLPAKDRIFSVAWIGYNDLAVERAFQWVDSDSTSTYSNWDKGEPNNDSGFGHCTHFYVVVEPQYDYSKWNDLSCDYLGQFVCEAPAGIK